MGRGICGNRVVNPHLWHSIFLYSPKPQGHGPIKALERVKGLEEELCVGGCCSSSFVWPSLELLKGFFACLSFGELSLDLFVDMFLNCIQKWPTQCT